jgi:hypothetical protein
MSVVQCHLMHSVYLKKLSAFFFIFRQSERNKVCGRSTQNLLKNVISKDFKRNVFWGYRLDSSRSA